MMQGDMMMDLTGEGSGKRPVRAPRRKTPDTTIDWVQAQTGAVRILLCEQRGHDWHIAGPIETVQDKPAAMLECSRCEARGFHWVPVRLLRKGGLAL